MFWAFVFETEIYYKENNTNTYNYNWTRHFVQSKTCEKRYTLLFYSVHNWIHKLSNVQQICPRISSINTSELINLRPKNLFDLFVHKTSKLRTKISAQTILLDSFMSETIKRIQSDFYVQQNWLCKFDYARFVTLLNGFISDVSNSINFLKN